MKPVFEIRKEIDNTWQLYHLPTGLPLPHTNLMSYGKNKKKDVKALMDHIKDKFPWHEWTEADIDNRPKWGSDAVHSVREFIKQYTMKG